MATAIDGLKPESVWKYFAEICKIPRGSKNEKQIASYVVQTAKSLGLPVQQDKFMNVVVKKPASIGKESFPVICLQGHLDMVCEKNGDVKHDFEKDPIELVRKDNVLMANGTTLGADNGIAVATNLAIMEDGSLEHGPLELLFTVDEETGLTGANNLKPGFVKAKTLLNLDSEEEGILYVGCSGGKNTVATWKLKIGNPPADSTPMMLRVKGLRGGHSGSDIEKGKGNSIKIIARVLSALEPMDVRLSRLDGGNKSNAIPREAEALLFVPTRKVNQVKKIVVEFLETIKGEMSTADPDVSILIENVKETGKAKVIKRGQTEKLFQTISALPHGVIKMSADISGLVETSTNVAIVHTKGKKMEITTSQRSSVASEIQDITQSVAAVFRLGGADVRFTEGYPGWKPNLGSPILKIAQSTYKDLFGKDPEVKAIHAGLECGIIGEKYPGIDMISFGPTLEGVHSPEEKIYIDTVELFWKYLLAILKNIN
jgi:dipeptidase D